MTVDFLTCCDDDVWTTPLVTCILTLFSSMFGMVEGNEADIEVEVEAEAAATVVWDESAEEDAARNLRLCSETDK